MRGDYEILTRLRDRDQAALETAIRRYSGYVAAVVKKTLGDDCARQDIEELTADAFVALWANAGKLRDDSDLKYWLAIVVRNASLRRRQKSVSTVPLGKTWSLTGPPPPKPRSGSAYGRCGRRSTDWSPSIGRYS